MEGTPKILIVEDSEGFQALWKAEIEEENEHVRVLQATTVEEGDLLLDAHASDIVVAVFDACLHTKEPNTLALVQKARKVLGPSRPLIAISGQPDFQKLLCDAGCNVECPEKLDPVGCLKEQKLIPIVTRLLELSDVGL